MQPPHPLLEFLSSHVLRLTTLDATGNVLAYGTGFIVFDTLYDRDFWPYAPANGPIEAGYFLYTCWHVVTGIDFIDPKLPHSYSQPRTLRIEGRYFEYDNGQRNSVRGPHVMELPLYGDNGHSRWRQQNQHRKNGLIKDCTGISIPRQLDVVRIPLKTGELVDQWAMPLKVLDDGVTPLIGWDVFIAGYPYGFSAGGDVLIEPIYLKRSIASSNSMGPLSILLDGVGAQAMSGAPVFLLHEQKWVLAGVYRGLVNPSFLQGKSEDNTKMGIIAGYVSARETLRSPLGMAHLDLTGPGTPTQFAGPPAWP